MHITLVSPPWPLFNRPSIQLGALKAFLKARVPGIRISVRHPYIRLASAIGYETYHTISQSSWAAESVFAALLFPDHQGPEKLFYDAIGKRFGTKGGRPDFRKIVSAAGQVMEEFILSDESPPASLVGISLCLNQLTAGLYIAKFIKKQLPFCKIVIGGASSSGISGRAIMAAFPFVDFSITGEGELPLLDLCLYLSGKKDSISSPAIASRDRVDKDTSETAVRKEQIPDLDSLPFPDFDDYFAEIEALGSRAAGITPMLPVEASRGCWWSRCNFCNLNLQWKGYRAKSPERITAEIDYLAQRYHALDYAFMDNCLPARQAPKFFDLLHAHGRDYSFFAELRVGHSRTDIFRMAAGGLRDVQVGIEALSTSLLRRLGKGSRAIDNLAMMRHCAEAGIKLQANLILHFPGSTVEEVDETLENLDFAWPFAPLKPVSFWLGMESPVSRQPKDFGISGIKPHPCYSMLFPREVAGRLHPLVLQYRGDRLRQKLMWKKLTDKLSAMGSARRRLSGAKGFLTFRDGVDFLVIRQVMPDGQVLRHRLSGMSRKLYLACLEPADMDSLLNISDGLPKQKIRAFMDGMQAKRLVYGEDDEYLALAIHERNVMPAGQCSETGTGG